eukprot:CAMPEP_0203695580 /NCGR_PEP_ID=MMETSP0091-20130426/7010_1 /ASSEMBLY_ACC=CAM_ASM_001089 /TAXON_ID=426623 /ORGANISM="Chaetoceros affinis, Strain CCMP159" /LENGTH=376 /DNA_ID=CAMNT_0050567167 /DNA_START=355 /DNA_END=1485 /DNA_ORIENTATION=+
MEIEFSNSFYAPFAYVSLTGTDRRRLEFNSLDETSESLKIVPVRDGNLRKRRGEVFNVSKKYDGVAVFTRDGDLPIPPSNTLQSMQLQAHADEYNELLYMLRSASPETGLDRVASVSLSVDVNYGNTGLQQPIPQNTDYDFIIIVAVIVAGFSMVLLAFALFLAFRRKGQHRPRPMVQTKLSPRTETDRSPTSRERCTPPPVQVMEVHHQHDDNISEYTESVFSLPTQTKQMKIKESIAIASKTKHHRVSSRFNPKYIISSKRSSDGGSQESNNDDEASAEVPHLASSEEKIETLDSNSKPIESNNSPKRSGLYPADVIDDDITSSLSAYGKGIGVRNQYQNDDGLSLSSVESYGFSLDGVGGDQSTYANSTKYGY